ncbi:MAG TPA: signal peptidase II [Pirellulales bacterium]|nr:signal peptidase II [Pirellulales bacterium]
MKAVAANRYVVFSAIAVVGCALDLATKHWVFAALGRPGGRTWWIWEGIFGFQTSLNEGALFGMGQGKVWLFAALSVAAALGIVYWLFVAGAARDRLLNVALGCVMAGILGNLYDRLGFWSLPDGPAGRVHAVRDWILVKYQTWVWPNFNLADSFLVCGAALLVWHAFRAEAAPQKSDTTAPGVRSS